MEGGEYKIGSEEGQKTGEDEGMMYGTSNPLYQREVRGLSSVHSE